MAWTLQLADDTYADLSTPIGYSVNITLVVNVVVDALDSTRRSIIGNDQAHTDLSNKRFLLGINENDKFFFSTGSQNKDKVFSGTIVVGQEYELRVELLGIPPTSTYGGSEHFYVDGVEHGQSSTIRGEVWAENLPPRYLGCIPAWVGHTSRGGMLGKIVSASATSDSYFYTWAPEASDRSDTGAMPILIDTTMGNSWVGTSGFATNGSDWETFGSDPALTIDQSSIAPGGAISGSYAHFSSVPPSQITLTDSQGNVNTITVTVNDSGSGAGTFSGTMPTLPSAGSSANYLLFGTVTPALAGISGADINFDSESGRSYITLNSYVSPVVWTQTPIANEQIEFPDAISIADNGAVFGSSGTYTIRHIRLDGTVDAISYTQTNSAPQFSEMADVFANVGSVASLNLVATDANVGDTLSYSVNTLPDGLTLVGASVQGTYQTAQTVISTFTVQDSSGEVGNDSDQMVVMFSVAQPGYSITTLVDYHNLNPNSPLIEAITNTDLRAPDQIYYPSAPGGRQVMFSSDGLLSFQGTRTIVISNIFILDASNNFTPIGPFEVTARGTGPELSSILQVIQTTVDGALAQFTADENGEYRFIVVDGGSATPSAQQVIVGVDSSDAAPLFDTGLQTMSANVQVGLTISGLAQGASYTSFLAMRDQYGGLTLSDPLHFVTTIAVNPELRPRLLEPFPDLELLVGTSVLIIPNPRFSLADNITLSGLPNGSGLTYDGSSLSGTLNTVDRQSSPSILTFNAINSHGSLPVSFMLRVYGAILDPGTIATPEARTFKINQKRIMSLKNFYQDATDRLDYAADMGDWLGSDTIQNVIVAEGGHFVDSGSFEDKRFMVFVSNGTLGESSKITCRVTTSVGRIADISFNIIFVEL